MSADQPSTAQRRALRALQRDGADYYRQQADLAAVTDPAAQAQWLAMADELDAYIASQEPATGPVSTDVPLFEEPRPPPPPVRPSSQPLPADPDRRS